MKRFLPDPFILALLTTLLAATLLPATGGAAVGVELLSKASIALLFFFLGAKFSPQSMVEGVRHWRLHLAIFGSTFVMFPLLGMLLARLFPHLLAPPIWIGILFVAALPSTVQSSIAFTSIAHGNVPAAIASASVSQLLGILLTPILVHLLSGAHGAAMPINGFGAIIFQILVPFAVGHGLRPWIGVWVAEHKRLITVTDRATIIIAVYGAFSTAIVNGLWRRLPLAQLVTLLLICLFILIIALLFTRTLARLLGFNRADEIATVFCGTKKSLVQGIPMARILFSGPDVGLILLPIMIFHQLQLMACAYIAQRYARGTEPL